MGFDAGAIGFSPGADHRWSLRGNEPNTHARNTALLDQKTPEQINQEKRQKFFLASLDEHKSVSPAEYKAVLDAWKDQLPYLSPENDRALRGKPLPSIDSLLAEKKTAGPFTQYGTLTLRTKDAPLFEKLQRELAGIDKKRAARQLYQLTHGHMPTRIMFSETGISAALQNIAAKNLIHIDTKFGALDPRTGTVTSLAQMLGHEIEHANIPGKIFESLIKRTDQVFSNAEELRVIDGYENGMFQSAGKPERSTHASHLVPIDPADGKSIAFPYQSSAGEKGMQYLRPGHALSGQLTHVDDTVFRIKQADGSTIDFKTKDVLLSIFGGGQLQRLGLTNAPSLLDVKDGVKTLQAVQKKMADPKLANLDEEHRHFAQIEQLMLHSPEVQDQIGKWQKAAGRGDNVTLSISKKGVINLARLSNDPEEGAIQAQRHYRSLHLDRDQKRMLRNTLIALLLLGTVVAAGGLLLLVAMRRALRH